LRAVSASVADEVCEYNRLRNGDPMDTGSDWEKRNTEANIKSGFFKKGIL
jgi:hypothetical protein